MYGKLVCRIPHWPLEYNLPDMPEKTLEKSMGFLWAEIAKKGLALKFGGMRKFRKEYSAYIKQVRLSML
jgi:hypothetical protein